MCKPRCYRRDRPKKKSQFFSRNYNLIASPPKIFPQWRTERARQLGPVRPRTGTVERKKRKKKKRRKKKKKTEGKKRSRRHRKIDRKTERKGRKEGEEARALDDI